MSALTLDLPPRAELLAYLRYRVADPGADVQLEVSEYLATRTPTEAPRYWTAHTTPTEFYANARAFYVGMLDGHLRMPHLLGRTGLLVAVARACGFRSFADWGAGCGRDGIVMARIGCRTVHLDVPGEGTELAAWRYRQRGLPVIVGDVGNPPDETFELVSSFDCLEHVEDPVAVLARIVASVRPGGMLVLAADLYNFDLERPGPHLAKNAVYAGVIQLAMERLGLVKCALGNGNHWFDCASADAVIWHRPLGARWAGSEVHDRLREETRKLLERFRSFYDIEISRLTLAPGGRQGGAERSMTGVH